MHFCFMKVNGEYVFFPFSGCWFASKVTERELVSISIQMIYKFKNKTNKRLIPYLNVSGA